MININSYVISERAVYQGVSQGVEKLLKDVNNFSKPEVVVDTIAESVMSELCDIMDFGVQPVRFTPDLMRKIWNMAQEQMQQAQKEPEPKS